MCAIPEELGVRGRQLAADYYGGISALITLRCSQLDCLDLVVHFEVQGVEITNQRSPREGYRRWLKIALARL